MLLKDRKVKLETRNIMIWLLLCEINTLYDIVFMFHHKYTALEIFHCCTEYNRLNNYLKNKVNGHPK